MRQLTIERRAKRATTRINRVAAEKYPLFVKEFSTTIEEQEKRIAQKGANFQAHWSKVKEFDEGISELGMDRREVDSVQTWWNATTKQEMKYGQLFNV